MPKLDRSLLERPGLDRTLGLEYLEASPDRVTARLQVDERHLQPFGYLHGGVSVALAESVASAGANLAAPEGSVAFGQEINANHLRPVRQGAKLAFVARPLHVGRSSQVWSVEIRDAEEKLVCVSRCTLAVVPLESA
ncbi:PaaI family thioesterase [Oceanithermus sp.]